MACYHSYTGMLAFFAVPLVMIGYSSIQKISFQDGAVTIEKDATQLQATPTNAALRSNLAARVASLTSRPTSDPAVLTSIAKAQFALRHAAAAESNLQRRCGRRRPCQRP